jgi:hypothetical protein
MKFFAKENGNLHVELLDLTSKSIQMLFNGEWKAGYHQLNMSLNEDLAEGLYFVKVVFNQEVYYQKLVHNKK